MIAGFAAAIAYFVFLTPSGCNEGGGTTSWERCTSLLGTPAFSVVDFGLDATLDVVPPVLIGLLVGLITWWLLDLYRPEGSGQSQVSTEPSENSDLAEDQ